MEKKKYPKVIVTGIDAWRSDVGANTLPNFFSSWNPDQLVVVYTKSELPETRLCNSFFQISENEVLHAAIHPGKKCGKPVRNVSPEKSDAQREEAIAKEVIEERKRYDFFRNHRWSLIYLAREILWNFGSWKSEEFDEFLKQVDADVIFFPIYPYVYMNKIQSYIAKKTGLRGVAYIADDNYSYKPEWYNPLFIIRRFFLRKSIEEVMKYCDELLVILPMLKKEYVKQFNVPIKVLTKGIDVEKCSFTNSSRKFPLKMVYTGNLFIGRDKSIIKVIKAIDRINHENGETLIQLDIYSHIHLSKKLISKLNIKGSSSFKGAVPISKVENIQNMADIVLFVEGIDCFNRNKARLSFSTKLTDYFKSGKCIFAVGKTNIAPIDYLLNNNAAIIASSEQAIYLQLKKILARPELIDKYGKAAYTLGIKKHSDRVMKNTLYSSLKGAAKR
ncbi:hypothetical protein [Hungatella hathewayi]